MDQKPLEYAAGMMLKTLDTIKSEEKAGKSSRELSLAKTNLEQAMMWLNKDRTIKGELKPYPTHAEG